MISEPIKRAALEVGGQAALARAVGVSPALVYQWLRLIRPVAAEHCPDIERVTGGAVRCEDLRPDVDWAFLRGTKREAA